MDKERILALAGAEEGGPSSSPREHIFQPDPDAKPLFPAAYRGGRRIGVCTGCTINTSMSQLSLTLSLRASQCDASDDIDETYLTDQCLP